MQAPPETVVVKVPRGELETTIINIITMMMMMMIGITIAIMALISTMPRRFGLWLQRSRTHLE